MTNEEKKVLHALRSVISRRTAAHRVPECATWIEVYQELAEDATTDCLTVSEHIGALRDAWPHPKLSAALASLERDGLIYSRPAQNYTSYYLTEKSKEME